MTETRMGARAGAAPRLLGAVLAGGASTRYGAPKWRAQVGGQPMAARSVAALTPHVSRVVAVSSDPRLARLGVEVRPDLEPGRGPLEGIRTALGWCTELSLDGVVVLACDLPLVPAALVGALVDGWRGEDAVAPLGPTGPEPLCALYAAAAAAAVERALSRGRLSPRGLLETLEVRLLPLEEARNAAGCESPFLNVNTRAARRRAEAVLAAPGTPAPGASFRGGR